MRTNGRMLTVQRMPIVRRSSVGATAEEIVCLWRECTVRRVGARLVAQWGLWSGCVDGNVNET